MKSRRFIFIVLFIMFFSVNVSARSYNFYIDSTCGQDEEDCYTNLDDAFAAVKDDKTTSSDSINLNMCNPTASFSHSYTINGNLKFVVDDVGNENKFELNGNNNTITTGQYVEVTGNSEVTISNLNIKDTYADATEYTFTLALYSQITKLNSVSVASLKNVGILAGGNLSEHEFDSVQVSGADVGLDYFGKSLSVNNSTFEDNTMGFVLSDCEGTISNSKINSIRAYDEAHIIIDKTNTLVNNPLKFFPNDDDSHYLDLDLDDYFVVSFGSEAVIEMDLVKSFDAVINKDSDKIDIFKLFNGVEDIDLSSVDWVSSNNDVATIKDGFVLLLDEGECSVSGFIPNTRAKLTVNFVVTKEKDNSFKGTVKEIVSNPNTYSTLFVGFLLVFVVASTLVVYNKRRKEDLMKDVF